MLIIGCDYHPGFQQIAFVDTETGECGERRLGHREEAEQFYRKLGERSLRVRVGMEASGHARWFEHLLSELQFELWIGDAAEIRTKRVRKQKTDRQDVQLLLRLMIEDRFPRIWVADAANRDLRQLLWHRHRLVQMRTRVMNQLHVVALNEGLRRKKALWRPAGRNQLESLKLAPWASRRRQDLLDLLDQLTPKIQDLTRALEEEVEKRPVTRRLMTHPGVNASGRTLGFLKALKGGTAIVFAVPGANVTQFLGVNDSGIAVGVYVDSTGLNHGVVYNPANGQWNTVDDPSGVNGTVLNGINNKNDAVGFYTDAANNTHGTLVTGII